jgi:hypothetical protein
MQHPDGPILGSSVCQIKPGSSPRAPFENGKARLPLFEKIDVRSSEWVYLDKRWAGCCEWQFGRWVNECMKRLLFALLLCGLMTIGLSAAPVKIYVSPRGNDRWSGRLASPAAFNNVPSDGPKATIEAALTIARALKGTSAPDGVSIILRNGVYELEAPIKLGPEDSGTDPQHPFTIEAYPGETPVISGGRRITGWIRVEGTPGLWETTIPEVKDGPWYFRQLFIDGQRKQRARTPNQGFFRIQGASSQDKPVKLKFAPGEIKKQWANDGDVEVIALLAWSDLRMQIRAVDEETHVATLSGDARPSNQESNARYFIENAPDGLDTPGEWYLNRKTSVLRYQAEPGQDLAKAEVIAPRLQELLLIQADFSAQKPVRNLVLRGLTFSHTDWDLGPNGYADTQAAIARHGDIRAEGAFDCAVEDCTFTHLAGYALEFGHGCQRNRVIGNEMFDLGAGGIRIGEPNVPQNSFDANHGQIVTDNHLHRLGRVYPPAVGVLVLQSGQNRIAHNHIHDLYYTAVSVGWNWGYQETPCYDNIVEFNHLHDIGQSMLSDMGAVYTLGIQHGTIIRNNLIHDVNSFTYGGWGLYPDEGSTDIVWENNVVYRTKSAGFHQHYGRENVVRNNIFAFGKEHQLMRTRDETHTSFILTNNIVYFDSGDLLGSSWKNDRFVIDSNVYFDARPGATLEGMKFTGATLEEWRARGHDLHSVIADPIFVAPGQFDFRLRENSPALKLGFHPIDVSRVGVRPKRLRVHQIQLAPEKSAGK